MSTEKKKAKFEINKPFTYCKRAAS